MRRPAVKPEVRPPGTPAERLERRPWRRRAARRLLVVARVLPEAPREPRAARKRRTVRCRENGEMTTLPEPSAASRAGNGLFWIGLSADVATSLSSERIARL